MRSRESSAMNTFKLQLREDRPATIEEHRALRDEVARLRSALTDIMSYIDAGQDPPSGQRHVPITIIQNGRDALRR
jgi:hypothetical protein